MLKKYGWIAALFVAIAMVFMGCPGDDNKPGPGPVNPPEQVDGEAFWLDFTDYSGAPIPDGGSLESSGASTITANPDGTLSVNANENQRIFFNLTAEQKAKVIAAYAAGETVQVHLVATGSGDIRMFFCDPTAGASFNGSGGNDATATLSGSDTPIVKTLTKANNNDDLYNAFMIQARGAGNRDFVIHELIIIIGEVTELPPKPITVVTVTDLAIVGVNAPAYLDVPVTEIDNDQYTGIIEWSPTVLNEEFAGEQIYTAVITLTAKAGYKFEGVEADSFTLDDVDTDSITSIGNAADSGIVTVVFVATTLDLAIVDSFELTSTEGYVNHEIHLTADVLDEDGHHIHRHITWTLDTTNPGSANSAVDLNLLAEGILFVEDAIGTVTLMASVLHGLGLDTPYETESGDISVTIDTIEVTGITGFPTAGVAGVPVNFSGVTVAPNTATFKDITWELSDNGGTSWSNFTLTSNAYTFTDAGTYSLRATVVNGKKADADTLADFVTDGSNEIVISVIVGADTEDELTFTPDTNLVSSIFSLATAGVAAIGTSTTPIKTSGSVAVAIDTNGFNVTNRTSDFNGVDLIMADLDINPATRLIKVTVRGNAIGPDGLTIAGGQIALRYPENPWASYATATMTTPGTPFELVNVLPANLVAPHLAIRIGTNTNAANTSFRITRIEIEDVGARVTDIVDDMSSVMRGADGLPYYADGSNGTIVATADGIVVTNIVNGYDGLALQPRLGGGTTPTAWTAGQRIVVRGKVDSVAGGGTVDMVLQGSGGGYTVYFTDADKSAGDTFELIIEIDSGNVDTVVANGNITVRGSGDQLIGGGYTITGIWIKNP